MIEVYEKIEQLKMSAPDGKMCLTDCVSIEEAFPGYADNPLGLALRGHVTERDSRRDSLPI